MIAILLCTYNGDKYLSQQLKSIEIQTYQNWMIVASDDGSNDSTLNILREYQLKWKGKKFIIKQGPRDGYSSNFLYLATDPEIKAKYYAFCDQDDIWHSDKLEIAIKNLSTNEVANKPYLYCSRSNYVLDDLTWYGLSPLKKKLPSFENALVENIAGGNTMVFNQATKNILEKIGVIKVVSHDWWTYLLVTSVGGTVFYDRIPRIDYRQHKNSLIGSGYRIIPRIKRIYDVFNGSKKLQYNLNIEGLMVLKKMLPRKHINILIAFLRLRKSNFQKRIILIIKLKLYKQNPIENFGLFIALLFRRL